MCRTGKAILSLLYITDNLDVFRRIRSLEHSGAYARNYTVIALTIN